MLVGFDTLAEDDFNGRREILILGLKVRRGFEVVFVLSPSTAFVLGDNSP
jgi:hypothetical protein